MDADGEDLELEDVDVMMEDSGDAPEEDSYDPLALPDGMVMDIDGADVDGSAVDAAP